jgi:hypothetical protein
VLSDRAAPAPAAPAAPAPLPFRGSVFFFDQSLSWETIDRSSQLSRADSYYWWMSFRPRVYFHKWVSLRARQDLTIEWTNQADTTSYREPQWGDLWTDLVFAASIPKADLGVSVGIRAIWPISLASREKI